MKKHANCLNCSIQTFTNLRITEHLTWEFWQLMEMLWPSQAQSISSKYIKVAFEITLKLGGGGGHIGLKVLKPKQEGIAKN